MAAARFARFRVFAFQPVALLGKSCMLIYLQLSKTCRIFPDSLFYNIIAPLQKILYNKGELNDYKTR